MDKAILAAVLFMGAVFGSLMTYAWLADRERKLPEPTEHGGNPL